MPKVVTAEDLEPTGSRILDAVKNEIESSKSSTSYNDSAPYYDCEWHDSGTPGNE